MCPPPHLGTLNGAFPDRPLHHRFSRDACVALVYHEGTRSHEITKNVLAGALRVPGARALRVITLFAPGIFEFRLMGIRRRLDATIVGALFVSAMTVGVLPGVRAANAPPNPGSRALCRGGVCVRAWLRGSGYAESGGRGLPREKIDRMSCAACLAMRRWVPNFTQALYRYMALSTGVTWNCWESLGRTSRAARFALRGIGGRLMRVPACRTVLAVAGALIMTVSPLAAISAQLGTMRKRRSSCVDLHARAARRGAVLAAPAPGRGDRLRRGDGHRFRLPERSAHQPVAVHRDGRVVCPRAAAVAPPDEAGGPRAMCRVVRRVRLADHRGLSIGEQHGARGVFGLDDVFQHAARRHRVGLRLGRPL